MLEITKRREHKEVKGFERYFEWSHCSGTGYGFPCDQDGNVDLTNMCEKAVENYNLCVAGTMRSKSGSGVVDKGIRAWTNRWVEPAEARCICGHIIQLAAFTNTCERCNRDYNMSGQELAPRCQWGEETGETASDILQCGHHIS